MGCAQGAVPVTAEVRLFHTIQLLSWGRGVGMTAARRLCLPRRSGEGLPEATASAHSSSAASAPYRTPPALAAGPDTSRIMTDPPFRRDMCHTSQCGSIHATTSPQVIVLTFREPAPGTVNGGSCESHASSASSTGYRRVFLVSGDRRRSVLEGEAAWCQDCPQGRSRPRCDHRGRRGRPTRDEAALQPEQHAVGGGPAHCPERACAVRSRSPRHGVEHRYRSPC